MTDPASNIALVPALAMRGIRKEYPGVVALDGVDLDILPNEILGLVGENGAGKSTLMKVMIGLVQPDAGTIELAGERVVLADPRQAVERGVGMVFQEGCLIPNLTILESLFLCHELQFRRRGLLSGRAMREEARRVLAELNLVLDVDVPVGEVTPATRQMVEIARLLWLSSLYGQKNPVLILDEPTTVLNDDERATLFDSLRRLKRRASVVFISHRLQEVLENTDRIVVLKDGRKVAELPAAQAKPAEIEELMVGHTFATDRYREHEQAVPGSEVLLEVKELSRHKAFDPLSFSVRRGEIVSLVGLVGSGKEAVCRCINGLERPDGGAVYLGGKKISAGSPSEAVRRGIGHVPVDRRADGLALAMSVSENINLLVLEQLRVAGFIAPRLEAKNARRWIDDCRIKTPSARALAGTLSGGNQQKTVIAKWLSSSVKMLVLDHPTRGRGRGRQGRDLPHPPRAGPRWGGHARHVRHAGGGHRALQPGAHHEGWTRGEGGRLRPGSEAHPPRDHPVHRLAEDGEDAVAIRMDGNVDGAQVAVARRRKLLIAPSYIPMALLALVAIAFAFGNPNFVSAYNINTILVYAAPLLMVALGQMCVILVGGTDLSVGGMISFVSCLFVVVLPRAGPWAYPLCLAVGVVLGYVNGVVVTRVRIPSFIATLGTGGILASLSMLLAPVPVNVPGSHQGLLEVVTGSTLGVDNSLYVGIVVFAAFYVVLRFLPQGRRIFYVGSNIRMAWTSGIDEARVRNLAFVLCGVGSALSALTLSASQFGSNPYLGAPFVLASIATVVVGGTALTGGAGGPFNTLFGALMMSMLQNGMNVVGIDQYFQQSILGIMIIVCVVLTFDRSKTPVIK